MDETLAHFASPAKRRKMCFVADESGDLCSPDSKSTASRLKTATTPRASKHAHQPEPGTPGSKGLAAGMDDGLLSVSPELLPANLMLLNQLLGALYVTMPLVKSRGKSTTYQNLKVPVQNFTGRDFQIRHVQQIKALCPEALGWEHILATNSTTKKQEQQLMLRMPSSSDKGKHADTAQMQQLFFKRLQQHVLKHKASSGEPHVPQAELPPLAGPNARDCTPNRRPITSDLLPGTPQTAPPGGAVGRTHGSTNTSTTAHNLLMSPPPKRAAATVARGRLGGVEGLMSPAPARTRASRSRQAGMNEDEPSTAGFTFSPAPRQPSLLFSPSAAGMRALGTPSSMHDSSNSHHTPVKAAGEDSAAAEDVGTKTPSLRPNKLFGTPMATATPQQTSTSRRPTDKHNTPAADAGAGARAEPAGPGAAGVKVRKLTFGAAASSSAAGAAAVAAEAKQKKASKPGGITFELGDSTMALLRKVSNVEVQRENAARLQELDQQRALDMLPGTFDVIRAVFGERGPCVKPKSEVLLLLRQKSTCKSGMSPADAAEQLELLLRLVPEFVRTINAPGQSLAGLAQSVRINRQVTWPAARQKLLVAAAQACTSGTAAAAQALAAEKEREEQQAAAAAAAAAAKESVAGESREGDDMEQESEDGASVLDGAGDELNIVDQTGLDILAQLGGGNKASGSSSKASSSSKGVGSMTDELQMLLSGGGSKASSKAVPAKGGMSDTLLSCLAFKAPARKSS